MATSICTRIGGAVAEGLSVCFADKAAAPNMKNTEGGALDFGQEARSIGVDKVLEAALR
jgi:hypothetical protein